MNTFAKRLKELRLAKGMTLKEVSGQFGITLGAYAHYEQGIREPSYDLLARICDFFDVSSDYLIGRTDIY